VRVATDTDPRLLLARDAHASAHGHDQAARDRRDTRDAVVRELRAEDPKTWTLSRLAAAVGCSKELIAYILKTG
jgi:AraC-like DNA-binding protein